MSNVTDIQKGQTILMESRPYHGNRRGEPKVENVTVVKVGREYIYVQPKNQARYDPLKFLRNTGRGARETHAEGSELFPDLVVYEKETLRRNLIGATNASLYGHGILTRRWDSLDDEELKTLSTLLKKLNGEAP